MDEKMKKVVVHGTKNHEIVMADKPVPKEGEVLIRIEGCGICAGDRSMYMGTAPWGEIENDMVLGHEYVGIVEVLGSRTGHLGLSVGDRCIAEIQIPCGKCYYCTHGLRHLCTDESGFLEGGWAQYMILRKNAIIHKVPLSIPKMNAVLIEPLSCSAHGVSRANISMKDVVVISGMGAIGLGMIQFAKLHTPYKLIGLDVNDEMLETAKEFGAEYVFNPAKQDVEEEIKKLTDGLGADIYIEASGNGRSLDMGLKVLRKRGRLVVYGVYPKPVQVDFNYVSEYKELEIVGGHLSPDTYDYVIKCLAQGLIHPEKMITDVYTLDQFEEAVYAKERNKHSIKTVLLPEC